MADFGRRLRRIRRAKDLTQEALAEKAGVNHVTISRIEKGVAKQVYVETLVRLAKALDITTDELLGLTDEDALCPGNVVEVGA